MTDIKGGLFHLPPFPKHLLSAIVILNMLLLFMGQLCLSFSVHWGSASLNKNGTAFEYSMW